MFEGGGRMRQARLPTVKSAMPAWIGQGEPNQTAMISAMPQEATKAVQRDSRSQENAGRSTMSVKDARPRASGAKSLTSSKSMPACTTGGTPGR